MAIEIKGQVHGEKVLGPPVGWRPRDLNIKEKLEIVVRQGGKEPGGDRLSPMEDGVEFHHDPALKRRRWDPVAEDTAPPALSLEHIVAINKTTHRDQTSKRDVPEIAKTKRLEAGRKKPKGRPIPNRPFPKRSKK